MPEPFELPRPRKANRILTLTPTLAQYSLAESLPVHDWQFWVVTLIAFLAFASLAVRLVPRRLRRSGTRSSVSLTIGGKSASTSGKHRG